MATRLTERSCQVWLKESETIVLRAEFVQLRVDSARLDKLERLVKKRQSVILEGTSRQIIMIVANDDGHDNHSAYTLRAAIDAAQEPEAKP